MSERPPRIVALPGDGIGPEIMAAARALLDAVGDFDVEEHPVGGASIDLHGTALTDAVLDACRSADAVLLAAVGGPRWDTTDPDAPRPEQGLLGLRKGLGLFANLRPVRPSAALLDASPRAGSPPAGRRRGPSFEIARYRAPAPVGVGPPFVGETRLDIEHPIIRLQPRG